MLETTGDINALHGPNNDPGLEAVSSEECGVRDAAARVSLVVAVIVLCQPVRRDPVVGPSRLVRSPR
ncbi:MAG: hypothetical protein WBL35_10645 [Ornithinibacter sp.]